MHDPKTPIAKETGAAPRILLAAADLAEIGAGVAEFAGLESSDEAIFRMGQRLGRRALVGDDETDLRRRFDAALEGLTRFGLERPSVESFALDASAGLCRVTVHLPGSFQKHPLDAHGMASEGPLCTLTLGFLTGLVAALGGVDVVCSPLPCQAGCALCGRLFEIRSTNTGLPYSPARPAPAGSARFFLGSLGRVFADSDLSLDDLLEHTLDAIVLIDANNVVRFWNRGAEEMFQYRREEIVGTRMGTIVPKDLLERDELGDLQRKLDRGEPVRNYITRRVRKDGEERWISLMRSALHDSRGQVIGSTAILRDITEQRRTEEELVRARTLALVGEMAAKVAHEIKNPLAGIYAAIQVLSRDVPAGDPRKQVFEDVAHEIRRLDDTLLDMLSFARPVPPRPRPTGLKNFVQDLLEPIRRRFAAAGVEFEVAIDPGLVVAVDGRLMAQVLENLLVNAAQALVGPGRVEITARREHETVIVQVLDSGPGIPPVHLETVFDPFFTTKARGTGLGLAIARKNVASHHGTIRAENRAGGGALFRIELPVQLSTSAPD